MHKLFRNHELIHPDSNHVKIFHMFETVTAGVLEPNFSMNLGLPNSGPGGDNCIPRSNLQIPGPHFHQASPCMITWQPEPDPEKLSGHKHVSPGRGRYQSA